ncbi:hypothetical protein ASG54_07755 [Aureimonas sp. Leaf460]|nr:hypothetical protein ASG62_13905 [Aureimonas sp. Leaf427]KQT80452.1 hypothetical protein ASG54_07755 [Aureimonas sp. Leaf460]
MHRITIISELDAGRDGTSVLTFSGRKGISFGRFLLMMIFVVMMLITIIGIVIVFITNRSSNKALERGFFDATTSAMEMVS